MIFAAHKQARRQGKKTNFQSRGKKFDDAEVGRYWKRKREKPSDFPPIPRTPEGVEYWTPAPTPCDTGTDTTPAQNVSTPNDIDIDIDSFRSDRPLSPRIVEICDDADDAASSPDEAMSWDVDVEACRDYESASRLSPSAVAFLQATSKILISNYQSSTLQPLDSPEAIKHYEHTVNCSREYFRWWIEEVHRSEIDWYHATSAIRGFRIAGRNLAAAIEQGYSKDHIEITYRDWIAMAPSIVHKENPDTIFTIMDLMVDTVTGFPKASPKLQKMLDYVMVQASNSWGQDHPSTILMRSLQRYLQRSRSNFFDFLRCALSPGKDLLSRDLGNHYNLVAIMLQVLVDAGLSGRETTALQYAQEWHQHELIEYRAEESDLALLNLLMSQIAIIDIQTKFGNYDEANELMKDSFGALDAFHEAKDWEEVSSHLLFRLGVLRYREGHLTAASDAFNQCLSLSLRVHGVSYHLTTQAAVWVQDIQKVDKAAKMQS